MTKSIMLFFVFYVIGLISAAPERQVYSEDDSLALFEEFIKVHNKQYSNQEKEERYKIFSDNLKEINDLNERSSHATFGITFFTDLRPEEFLQYYTLDENSLLKEFEKSKVSESFNYNVPDEFDWRSKGVVSKVKEQGHCGSAWAFSITGNVESINAIKSGKIVEVSEQQLIDCDHRSTGCAGGPPIYALRYLIKYGAMSSQSYPYEATDNNCRFNSSNVVIKLKDMEHQHLSEEDMKKKLYTTGPLIIMIAGRHLLNYKKGVLVEGCDDTFLSHSVLLVGYGQENGVPYWLIKNCWSSSWGEKGYFKIKRGINCLQLTEGGIYTAII